MNVSTVTTVIFISATGYTLVNHLTDSFYGEV